MTGKAPLDVLYHLTLVTKEGVISQQEDITIIIVVIIIIINIQVKYISSGMRN